MLDDSILAHPLELNLRQRLERSIYLSLDICGGIKEKYVQGNKKWDEVKKIITDKWKSEAK